MKHRLIDEMGNLAAAPGSRDWAIAVRHKLIDLIERQETTARHIAPYLEDLEKHEGYKQLESENDTHFVSVDEFLNAGFPFGLSGKVKRDEGGYSLGKHGRPAKGAKGSNTNLLRGDNKPYIIARLKRDHPQIAADFEAGKYRSARQAGIAAGFVKVRPVVTIPLDNVDKMAEIIKRKCTAEQIERLTQLLAI